MAALHAIVHELANDLHRAHFGGAGERARRKGGADDVPSAESRPKLALNLARDVHHVAVAFDEHAIGHHHGSGT